VIYFDSSFLIDLDNEIEKQAPAAAFEFLETLDANELLAVSVHVMAELRVGAELARHQVRTHEKLDRLLSGFLVVYPDLRFAAAYARVWAATNRKKRSVPAMDLFIATAAIIDDAPIVTANARDFSRVPGLRVLTY
jgi:predicted nucleic acid-binding protein